MNLRLPKVAVAVAAAAAMTFSAIPSADASTIYRATNTPKVVLGGAYGAGTVSSSNSAEALQIQCNILVWKPATWYQDGYWAALTSSLNKFGTGRVYFRANFTPQRGKSYKTRCYSGPRYTSGEMKTTYSGTLNYW